MTPTPDELLVVAALTDRAEQAMSQTDTESELRELLELGAVASVRRRRAWAAGALVAAALAVAGSVLWPVGNEPDPAIDPAPPTASATPMNADEQLAHDFTSAYFAYDRRLAASYVAPGATPALRIGLGRDGWLRQNRLDEALDSRSQVDGCYQIADLGTDGVRVGCLYTVDLLRMSEIGRGPFPDNLFIVTVRDGRVVDFITSLGRNDYETTAWSPFWAWIEDTRPAEVADLELMDEPDLTREEVGRVIRHWKQVGHAYVAALRSGEAP